MLQHIRKMNEPGASLLLVLLLCADFAIIVFFGVIEMIDEELCHPLGMCGSMHIYNLIKLFWIIILLAHVLKSTGNLGYVSWMIVFAFFFLDDVLLIHQKVGDYLSHSFASNPSSILSVGTRFYQLGVLGLFGIFLCVLVGWTYSHGTHVFRKISNDLLLLIAALIFFGLIIDLASAINLGPRFQFDLGLIEDGGEMVVNSLIVWSVYLLTLHHGQPELFLLDFFRRT